jgi:hypothetical protein
MTVVFALTVTEPSNECLCVLQRDVVSLGWPIAPSHLSPNAGGVARHQQMSTADTGAQINFGDLTPYLTYGVCGGGGGCYTPSH